MTLTPSATLYADPEVLATEFGDEVVLLNLRDGVYYGLEDVGRVIWTALRVPVTVQDICDAVVHAYDVEPDRCQRDVLAVIQDLIEHGLIQVQRT